MQESCAKMRFPLIGREKNTVDRVFHGWQKVLPIGKSARPDKSFWVKKLNVCLLTFTLKGKVNPAMELKESGWPFPSIILFCKESPIDSELRRFPLLEGLKPNQAFTPQDGDRSVGSTQTRMCRTLVQECKSWFFGLPNQKGLYNWN